MSGPKVLIIGCGVAGPIAAILLKRKGYEPIVFEKVARLGDAGASLALMPNGMNVLNLVGVADKVVAESDALRYFVERTAAGDLLAESGLPSSFEAKYGQPAAGIRRTTLSLMLKETLRDLGIELREGWKLLGLSETEHDVTAIFEKGESVTGSFLIGCDGIKSTVRRILLARKGISQAPPEYTGLVQVAGISETPESLVGKPAVRNWYGQGLHFIAYPISKTHTSWAATIAEERGEEESWRLYPPRELQAHTASLAALMDLDGSTWDPVIGEMVLAAERLVKFGLFDREELRASEWYSKRCVLIGDAAHPTSPHLGQGANQALEDSYNLCQSIPSVNDVERWPSFSLSAACFRPFAEKRQPRTSKLVMTARAIGEMRVTKNSQACEARNAAIVSAWKDKEGVEAKYKDLFTASFPAIVSSG